MHVDARRDSYLPLDIETPVVLTIFGYILCITETRVETNIPQYQCGWES